MGPSYLGCATAIMKAIMAALPEWPETRVVELRRVTAEDLNPLLEEEAAVWRATLDWDLRPSADLVRRFVRMQSLSGVALIRGGLVAGYAYYVTEEHKGLIGDLYVSARERTPEREAALIEAALDAMWSTPGVRRVESQLLMFGRAEGRSLPYAAWSSSYPRWFMRLRTSGVAELPARDVQGVEIIPWLEAYTDDSARLVTRAYENHVDSQINDQYRSITGARRFLNNIIQYPGCGSFFQPASFGAADKRLGMLCGMSLASLVAPDSGHITQVCVDPEHRETGLGYELLRRSLRALAMHGCRTVSLTVTAANREAIRVYERMGFTTIREFAANVWERDAARGPVAIR